VDAKATPWLESEQKVMWATAGASPHDAGASLALLF